MQDCRDRQSSLSLLILIGFLETFLHAQLKVRPTPAFVHFFEKKNEIARDGVSLRGSKEPAEITEKGGH